MLKSILTKAKKASLLASAVAMTGCAGSAPVNTPESQITGEATVHCLLPSRVQQLGSMTYASRRTLVYETASRCTLRGGEYTVYDRSTPENSAAFYRGPAEAGDPDAQYSLGLVYESLYNPPRYEDAAEWYSKAAEQNQPDAMKNLAYLYEQGLGVKQDRLMAVNLLREAGGITDDLVLRSELDAATSAAEADVRRLTAALNEQNSETAQLRANLLDVNEQLESQQDELLLSQQQVAALAAELKDVESTSGVSPAEVNALRTQLADSERSLSAKTLSIATLEADLVSFRAQLKASERKAQLQEQELLSQLAESEQATQSAQAEVARIQQEKDAEIAQLNGQLTELVASLEGERASKDTLLARIESDRGQLAANDLAAAEIDRLLGELAERETTIAGQMSRISALEQAASGAEQGVEAQTARVVALNEQVTALGGELQAQKAAYDRLREELAQSQTQLSATQASGETRVEELIAEIDRRGQVIGEQSDRITALESQMASTSATLATLQQETAQRISERDYLQAQLTAAEAELVRTQAALGELQTSLSAETLSRNSLEAEVQRLQAELDADDSSEAEVVQLTAMLAQRNSDLIRKDETIQRLNQEIAAREAELADVKLQREQQLVAMRTRSLPRPVYPKAPGFQLPEGRRLALIIGNDDYESLRDLSTAVNGAQAVDRILRERFGFETQLLINARGQEIKDALHRLRNQLEPDASVLIYYAGHGDRDRRDEEISYWLGVDARSDELALSTDGVSSMEISFSVKTMPAKHVMIIADSCYAGAMVRPPRVSKPRAEMNLKQLDFFVQKRSRTVLTSGGNSPVLDESVDGEHSVFTRALVEVLENTPDIMYGEALHAALVNLVEYDAEQLDFTQKPQFSEIADADHRNGQFVLKANRT